MRRLPDPLSSLRPSLGDFSKKENDMRMIYHRVVRTSLLWVMLLGAMTAMSAASAVVLAANQPVPLAACNGTCTSGADCGALNCGCSDFGGVCILKK